jgi:hypothetical protein
VTTWVHHSKWNGGVSGRPCAQAYGFRDSYAAYVLVRTAITARIDGDDVQVGRAIRLSLKSRGTKKDEGTNKRAVFDFYSMETDQYPFGVDKETDIVRTAKRMGVMTGTNWLYHESFPDGKLNGESATVKWLKEEAEPEVIEQIRTEVLDKMDTIVNNSTSNGALSTPEAS